MRSDEKANDFATTINVVKEVLASYKNRGKEFENICIIYPTAPFVSIKRLNEGFNKLGSYQACIPVVAFDYPVWRAFKLKEGTLSYQWPEYEKSRSQDIEPLYHDAGQWYWITTKAIKDSLVPEQTVSVKLNTLEVQDIDVESDWKLAELKFKLLSDE
jgi:N-acylneuraminate cytidylyltransferase